jgi:hypothetical protein
VDEKPECREGHRNDRLLDPGAVDVHVRVGTIEGEQEEGEGHSTAPLPPKRYEAKSYGTCEGREEAEDD